MGASSQIAAGTAMRGLTGCPGFAQEDKKKKVFFTLRMERSNAKLVGKREVAAKKKAAAISARNKKGNA